MSFRHRFSGKRLFATILVSTLLIANVSHTQTGKITVPMEQGAYVVEVSFRPYGSIVLATIVREVNGKTAVCGFWKVGDRWQAYIKKSRLPYRARGAAKVFIGNEFILTGVTFFPQVTEDEFKAGTMTNCEVSPVDWQPGFSNDKLRMQIPRMRSRV